MIISKKSQRRRRIISAACLVGIMLLGGGYYALTHATSRTPPKSTVQQPIRLPQTKKDTAYGLPVRLIIPKINVDANILYMGVTATGNMDVPADLENVGWYKYGPRPGDMGSAVIAGHLEGVKDLGVFINLDKLQTGDSLAVRDDKGVTTNFSVRTIKAYNQDERPNEIFHSDTGAHLNLITCAGIWNNATKRYSERLVVFADKNTARE